MSIVFAAQAVLDPREDAVSYLSTQYKLVEREALVGVAGYVVCHPTQARLNAVTLQGDRAMLTAYRFGLSNGQLAVDARFCVMAMPVEEVFVGTLLKLRAEKMEAALRSRKPAPPPAHWKGALWKTPSALRRGKAFILPGSDGESHRYAMAVPGESVGFENSLVVLEKGDDDDFPVWVSDLAFLPPCQKGIGGVGERQKVAWEGYLKGQ